MQCNCVALVAEAAGIQFLGLPFALVPAAAAPASGAHERAKQILIDPVRRLGRP